MALRETLQPVQAVDHGTDRVSKAQVSFVEGRPRLDPASDEYVRERLGALFGREVIEYTARNKTQEEHHRRVGWMGICVTTFGDDGLRDHQLICKGPVNYVEDPAARDLLGLLAMSQPTLHL